MKDNDQNKYDKSINKIADIENKINSIKSKHKLIDKDNVKPNLNNSQLGQTMQIGIEMAVGISLGGFAGFHIDKWQDSSPIMFIVFFFLGACSCMLTSYRTIKKLGLSPIINDTNKKQKNRKNNIG